MDESGLDGFRRQTILLRYDNEYPTVLDAAIMTFTQVAEVLYLTVHQVKTLEKRYFLNRYEGADDYIKIDLSKIDKEVNDRKKQ